MANQRQLKLLKAGVEGWNKWREQSSDREIDLREADLFSINLYHAALSRANLSDANLRGADLSEADLSDADLSGANLSRANLTGADISGANLGHASLKRADLFSADLSDTNHSKADLTEANLSEADLSGAYLSGADLSRARLDGADLSEARLDGARLDGDNLTKANLSRAILSSADLIGANLSGANLSRANLDDADLSRAVLFSADLYHADLSKANLSGADLTYSNLLGAKISDAKISGSKVFGVNVWDLEGEFNNQKELIITRPGESAITVDNIEIAQFIYLILNNKKIRDVINTLTSKTVLILGRFSIPERKLILDALRNKLREYDLLPIVFDFDRPTDKDFTETIKTLAGISYFVIADVTNPKSSPLELQAAIPDYQIPFVPIIQEGEFPFAMMVDLQKKYNWVLDTISYDSLDTLIDILKPHIIDPAIRKRDELRVIKAKIPTIISGKDLLSKR